MAKIEHEYSVDGGGIQGYDMDKKEIYWEIHGKNGWKECYPISELNEISLPFRRKNGWKFSLSIYRSMLPEHAKTRVRPLDSFMFRPMTKEKCLEMFKAIARDYAILHSLVELLGEQEYYEDGTPAPRPFPFLI